jgi:hypothetical protein
MLALSARLRPAELVGLVLAARAVADGVAGVAGGEADGPRPGAQELALAAVAVLNLRPGEDATIGPRGEGTLGPLVVILDLVAIVVILVFVAIEVILVLVAIVVILALVAIVVILVLVAIVALLVILVLVAIVVILYRVALMVILALVAMLARLRPAELVCLVLAARAVAD